MPQPSDRASKEDQAQILRGVLSRPITAYVLMCMFVICTSMGAAFIFPPAGLITLGVTSGIYAYLLGSD